MDFIRHIPRFPFSDRQTHLIVTLLRKLGFQNVPSASTLKDLDSALQKAFGIQTIRYEGALGHIYYVNDIRAIIAQVRIASLNSIYI